MRTDIETDFDAAAFARWRKYRGLSQVEISRRMEIGFLEPGRWERGEHQPTHTNVRELARVLNVPVEALLRRMVAA
jgi:transcriptional regulator with XRE-family HTH domain